MTILYIDDDIDDQQIFKEALFRISPYSVLHVASNGLEGIEKLNSLPYPPDYIFLDVNMPLMNGKEFLAKVKSTPKLSEIPIVVYSTSNNKTEIKDFIQNGAFDFITKSQTFSDVCNSLKRYL